MMERKSSCCTAAEEAQVCAPAGRQIGLSKKNSEVKTGLLLVKATNAHHGAGDAAEALCTPAAWLRSYFTLI
jgi:hypothetical protein